MRLDSSTGGLSPGSGSKEALVDWGGRLAAEPFKCPKRVHIQRI